MKIMIKETKQIRELSICNDRGIEWTQDLLGNAGVLNEYDNNSEYYVLSQGDYFWWLGYISDYTNDEKEIEDLSREHDIDPYKINEMIAEALRHNNDMDIEHTIKQSVFEQIRAEYK